MRFALLGIMALVGCGGTEAIEQSQFPIGCWAAPPAELDLRADGTMSQSGAGGQAKGSWSLQGDYLELSNSGALQFWHLTQLGPTEMQTDSGIVTNWSAIACK